MRRILSIKSRLSLNIWASILLFVVAIMAACVANSPIAPI